jgi:[NiFe] hydrogenase large subunit
MAANIPGSRRRVTTALCEVGPLARVLVAYGKGHRISNRWWTIPSRSWVRAGALFSTLGRTAASGLETVAIGDAMQGWIMELVENIKGGDTQTYEPYEMPDSAMGVGLNDVPRGALGHWIKIEDGKNRQLPVCGSVNLELRPPRQQGVLGPVEEALIGTPIADPKQPLEVLRTVHSFDPCIACAVHVIDPDSNEVYKFKVL